jgi:predicted RNA-binding protein with EMAP domain
MSGISLLIASWKAQRALLLHQLEMLERGEMRMVADDVDITQQEIARVKSWIAKLDELLIEYDE